jgi:glycosyltransferase involved in cell wall biosynthesis
VRILHVCQPTDGGAAVVVRQLVAAGVADGDFVAVACPAEGYLSGWVTAAGGRWLPLEMGRAPRPRDLLALIRLRALIKNIDVLHLHSSKAGALGRLAMLSRQPPARASVSKRSPRVIFTPHAWSFYVGGRSAALYRQFERQMSTLADVIAVVSIEEQQEGRRVLGSRANIELVENGVDTDRFSPEGPVAERRPEPLLVQVGRLSQQKAQDRTLRALAALPDQTARIRFVGEGPDRAGLERLAADLGVTDRVELVGSVDPRPHLRAADVVVLPSRWEGMSLVLLEAMSVGTAIVASDCGGSDALIGCGVLVDHVNDDRAIAELSTEISALLGDPDRRRRLADAARRRAGQRYSLERMVRRYRALWRNPPTS